MSAHALPHSSNYLRRVHDYWYVTLAVAFFLHVLLLRCNESLGWFAAGVASAQATPVEDETKTFLMIDQIEDSEPPPTARLEANVASRARDMVEEEKPDTHTPNSEGKSPVFEEPGGKVNSDDGTPTPPPPTPQQQEKPQIAKPAAAPPPVPEISLRKETPTPAKQEETPQTTPSIKSAEVPELNDNPKPNEETVDTISAVKSEANPKLAAQPKPEEKPQPEKTEKPEPKPIEKTPPKERTPENNQAQKSKPQDESVPVMKIGSRKEKTGREAADSKKSSAMIKGNLAYETLKARYPEYMKMVGERIQRNLDSVNAVSSRSFHIGKVALAFGIAEDGTLSKLELLEAPEEMVAEQGVAFRSIKASAPFPPLTEDMKKDIGLFNDIGVNIFFQ